MTLDEAREHIGHGVVYQPPYPGAPIEQGVITSVTEPDLGSRDRSAAPGYVFVRYGADYASKATRPQDLTLLLDRESSPPVESGESAPSHPRGASARGG